MRRIGSCPIALDRSEPTSAVGAGAENAESPSPCGNPEFPVVRGSERVPGGGGRGAVRAVGLLPLDHLAEEPRHLQLLAALPVELVPRVVVEVLQLRRRHLLRLEHDLIGGVL